MIRKFGEIGTGTRFCFRGRRYEKVSPNIGRDEERGGNVFHFHTEVLVEQPVCPNGGKRAIPPVPPALPGVERKRVCGIEKYKALQEELKAFSPPYQPPQDGWHGSYSGGTQN